jgi:hypothetical protein
MTTSENKNPLFDSQREKSGAQTFDKYAFQYHWALYRVIADHDKNNEYAVFVELHEDVVISDSLDVLVAKFEFNQVKTNKTPFNTYQLVSLKKGGNSVLGKLIKSSIGKPYAGAIKSLNLIAINQFNLELKKKNIELEVITKGDLSDGQLRDLEDELKKEIGIAGLPDNIKFIFSDLPDNKYQTFLIGAIAELINKLFPCSYCNAKDIYTLLIDELYRKGRVTYDFTQWDELLHSKALTSIQVAKVINEFTNLKDEAKIESEFISICDEIGLKSIETREIKKLFSRYRRQKIGNRSSLQIDTSSFFVKKIELNIAEGIKDMKVLIDSIYKEIPPKIGRQFSSKDAIVAALICEYIMMS